MTKEDAEDKIRLPIDVTSYSTEKLKTLQIDALEMVASVLESRPYQTAVRQAFAIGDIKIISEDRFPIIIEKLLLLSSRSGEGTSHPRKF